MLCPTTMRFLPLAGLALVVIVAVVLLAARRPILGLIIGLAVLALGGVLALPAFWCTSRSVAVRTTAGIPAAPALPTVPTPCEVSFLTMSGEHVVSFKVPAELLRNGDTGYPLDKPSLEVNQLPARTAWHGAVRKLADSLEQFGRSTKTDAALRRRLGRLEQDRLYKLASTLLRGERSALVQQARAAATADNDNAESRMHEAYFCRESILPALADLDMDPSKRAARPRRVVLSILVVSGLLIVAYSLLQAGLRRAAATRPSAPRYHG
jgi:hypothetical protein